MGKVQHTYAVRLVVEDGGAVKAELAVIGASGQQSLSLIEKGGENASKGLSSLTDRAQFLSKGLKSLAVVAAGAVSVGGLALMTKKAIDAAGALADTAFNLGINVEALQELRYAAELSGVAQESFDKSLEKFTRNIGAAAQGSGAAKDAFNILGVSVRDAEGNIRDTESVFRDVSDAMAGIENPTERVRLAFDLFGKQGVAMVNMLVQGSSAIDTMRQRARDLGIVLETDLIRDAEAAGDELDTLGKVVSVNLSRALLGLAPIIGDASSLLSELAAGAGVAYEKFKLFFSGDFGLNNLSLRAVRHDLQGVNDDIEKLQKRIADRIAAGAGGPQFFVESDVKRFQTMIDILEERRTKLVGQLQKLQSEQNATLNKPSNAPDIEADMLRLEEQAKNVSSLKDSLTQQVFEFTHQGANRVEAEYDRMVEQINGLKNEVNADEISSLLGQALEVKNFRLKQLADQEAQAEGKRNEAAEKRAAADLERQQKAYEANQKVVESLNAETAALGKSERQNYIDQAVRRLSAEATQAQRVEVERLAGALFDEKEALEERRKEEEKRKALIEDIKNLTEEQTSAQEKYNAEMQELNALLQQGAINQKEFEAASKRARDNMLQHSREWSDGVRRALESYADEASDMATQVEQVTGNTLRSLEDTLVEFTTTGKFEWNDMVNSMLSDIARLIVRTQITGPLAQNIGSIFDSIFGSANGNVFSNGRPVQGFAKGTVVFEPTLFPMANGIGLMGEAGPEAIMPLRRLPSGRLGVESAGGGGSSYSVNVDARGSSDPAATAKQVEIAVDRALSARIPGIVRTSTAAAKTQVIDTWQRRGGRFD